MFKEEWASSVSKVHAEFRKVKGRWVVLDLGSTNGTWVNGKRVRESGPLWSTDRVRFGRTGPLVEVHEQLEPEATAGFGQELVAETQVDMDPVPDEQPFVLRRGDTGALEGAVGESAGSGSENVDQPGPSRLPVDVEEAEGEGRADALRSILDKERDQLFLTRRLLRNSQQDRKRGQGTFLFLLVSLVALSYVAFEMKMKAADTVDDLVESCREPASDPAAAAQCQELLTRLFDEVAAACAGEAGRERMLEARCEQVEHMAYRVAAERAEAYRSEFREAVQGVEGRMPGFEAALADVLAKLGSSTVRVDSLPPAFVQTLEELIRKRQEPGERGLIQKQLCRKERCFRSFKPRFKEKGLPEIYGYMAWQESAFVADARSSAGAAGLWQFMPATAEHYGLKVPAKGEAGGAEGAPEDERLSPARSTRAAVRYLRDLRKIFREEHLEAPLLVMAAYNTGQGRVARERARLVPELRSEGRDAGERADFITLWLHEGLPQETLNYVPSILAYAMIGEHPELFGFSAADCGGGSCWSGGG